MVRDFTASGGYRTLSTAPMWLPAGLAGVNERGLAGAALFFSTRPLVSIAGTSPSRDREQTVHAPAWLLLDQCLERCDGAAKAIEWCAVRPGGGFAQLAFVDASGARMGIEIEGPARRRIDPELLGRPRQTGVDSGLRFVVESAAQPAACGISLARSGSPPEVFRFA